MRRPISGPAPLALPALSRWPGAVRLALWLTLGYGVGLLGCHETEEHKTWVAADERSNDLKKENQRLEQLAKGHLQARLATREADLAKQHEEGLRSLKADLEDRQARRHQLADEEAAQLENAIAGLQIELSAARREKLVLQGLVDRQPRVVNVRKARAGMIDAVLGLFAGLTLVVLIVVGSRHRQLRRQHDLLVVQGCAASHPDPGANT